jgi:hypothetical protein
MNVRSFVGALATGFFAACSGSDTATGPVEKPENTTLASEVSMIQLPARQTPNSLGAAFRDFGGAVAGFTTVSPTGASAAVERCPGGGPLIVNAYSTFRNAADAGADGHIWALDAGRDWIQIWQVGPNTYCLKRQVIGTFTTFAGVSPEGTGIVSGGVTGRFTGEIVAVIHGTFAPTAPTSGFLGDFDEQCRQDGTCLGFRFRPRRYFSSIDSFEFLAFGGTFEAGACGVWRQSIDGNTGDIVC